MSDELMSPADLHELTGFQQREKQREFLEDVGIPFRVLGERLIVSRIHVQEWRGGVRWREPQPAADVPEQAPRLNAGLAAWQAERRAIAAAGAALARQAIRAWNAAAPERRRVSKAAHRARRRAACRVPPWADRRAILAIYREAHRLTAETGIAHQVDHDIPLRGRLVSGLHVETNLCVLVGDDNMRKGNRFEPC